MKDLRFRLLLGAGIGLLFTFVYLGLQALTIGRVVWRSDCLGWRLLPFHEAWLWPYMSMFVLLAFPWLLLRERRELLRFASGMLAMAASGWLVFFLYPTACVRPPVTDPGWAYSLLLQTDLPNNCLPCLHSAFAVFGGLVLGTRVVWLRGAGARLVLLAWTLLIIVSIVALRQHSDLDTLAGVLLGAAVWSLQRYQYFL